MEANPQAKRGTMKNRTTHPAEFAGWRPSMVDAELWQTILWATTDSDGEPLERHHDISAAWREDMEALNAQFYSWRDLADEVMISHGLGELALEDLLGADRVERSYILARDGHDVSMADRWNDGAERDCCLALESLAVQQGKLGAYVGDDGRIYLACNA
jgi:hypothetical protein